MEGGDSDRMDAGYDCRNCNFVAPTISELKVHVGQHHLISCVNSGHCPYCDFRFEDDTVERQRIKAMIREHLWIVHDENLWQETSVPLTHRCETCTVSFYSVTQLEDHLAKGHHPQVPTAPAPQIVANDQTPSCNEALGLEPDDHHEEELECTTTGDGINSNLVSEFNNWATTVGFKFNGRYFVCCICEKKYKTLLFVDSHLESHGKRSFLNTSNCPVCNDYKYTGKIKNAQKQCVSLHLWSKHLGLDYRNRTLNSKNEITEFNKWASRKSFKFDVVLKRCVCLICERVIKSLRRMNSHLEKHGMPSFFVFPNCPLCDYKYKGKDDDKRMRNTVVQHINFQHLLVVRQGRSVENEVVYRKKENDPRQETIELQSRIVEDDEMPSTSAALRAELHDDRDINIQPATSDNEEPMGQVAKFNKWARTKNFIFDGKVYVCMLCAFRRSTLPSMENHLMQHGAAEFLNSSSCPLCTEYEYIGNYDADKRKHAINAHVNMVHLNYRLRRQLSSKPHKEHAMQLTKDQVQRRVGPRQTLGNGEAPSTSMSLRPTNEQNSGTTTHTVVLNECEAPSSNTALRPTEEECQSRRQPPKTKKSNVDVNQEFNSWAKPKGYYFDGAFFKCLWCDTECITFIAMDVHRQTFHGKRTAFTGLKCPICDSYEYSGSHKNLCSEVMSAISKHIQHSHVVHTNEGNQLYVSLNADAKQESKRFTKWSALKGFRNVNQKFVCTFCETTTESIVKIDRHLVYKHGKKRILVWKKCPLCLYEVKSTDNRIHYLRMQLGRHIERIHALSSRLVSKAYRVKNSIIKNSQTTQKDTLKKEASNANAFPSNAKIFEIERTKRWISTTGFSVRRNFFKCSQCQRKFKLYVSLIRHLEDFHYHESLFDPPECPICPYKYLGKYEASHQKSLTCITRHVFKHIQTAYPFLKGNSSTRTSQKLCDNASKPSKHLESTTVDKLQPSKTTTAASGNPPQTSYKYNKFVHRILRRLRSSKCMFCKKRFIKKESLKAHLKEDHTEDYKLCFLCKQKFFTNSALLMHRRINHFDITRPKSLTVPKFAQSSATKLTLHRYNLMHIPVLSKTLKPEFKNYHSFKLFCDYQLDKTDCDLCGNTVDRSKILEHFLMSHNPQCLTVNEVYVSSLQVNGACHICGIENISQTHINYHRFVMEDMPTGQNVRKKFVSFVQKNFFLSAELWSVYIKTLLFRRMLVINQVRLYLWIPFSARTMEDLLKGFKSYENQDKVISIPYYVGHELTCSRYYRSAPQFNSSSSFNLFSIPLFTPAQSNVGNTEEGCRTAFAELVLLTMGILHLRNGYDVFKNIKFQCVGRQHPKERLRKYLKWMTTADVKDMFEKIFDSETTIFCKNNVDGRKCAFSDCKAMAHYDQLAQMVREASVNGIPHVSITSNPPFKDVAFFRDSVNEIRRNGKQYYIDDFLLFLQNFKKTMTANVYIAVASKKAADFPVAESEGLRKRTNELVGEFFVYTGSSTFSGISPCSFKGDEVGNVGTSMTRANVQGYQHQYELLNEEFEHDKADIIEGLVQLGGVINDFKPTASQCKIKVINSRIDYKQLALVKYDTLLQFMKVCLSPSGFLLEDEPDDPSEGVVEYFGKRLVIKKSPKLPGSFPHIPRFDEQGNMHLERVEYMQQLENIDEIDPDEIEMHKF